MFHKHQSSFKFEGTGLPHYNTPQYNTDFNITRSCLGSQMVFSYCSNVNNLIITRFHLQHGLYLWTPKIAL